MLLSGGSRTENVGFIHLLKSFLHMFVALLGMAVKVEWKLGLELVDAEVNHERNPNKR